MNTCEAGRNAEHLAARYLRACGYHIWKSNWRWGRKELDLVTIFRGELVVVEVKARFENEVNHPVVVIHHHKRRNMILATEAFIRIYNSKLPTRFDVIAVIYRSGEVEIEHIRNAFYPEAE